MMNILRHRLVAAIARWDARRMRAGYGPYGAANALEALERALAEHAAGASLREALRANFNDRLLAALERAAGAELEARLPGMAPDYAGMLRARAAAPLRPKVAPVACDFGLFADHTPLDLVELARANR